MAATGSLFAHYVKFPGFEDVPTGLAALGTDKGLEGFSLLMFLIAGHEAVTWKPVKDPGSFGDPFQWKQLGTEMRSKDLLVLLVWSCMFSVSFHICILPRWTLRVQPCVTAYPWQEINNGRMAMAAIMGQVVAEMQTGKGPVEQFMGWDGIHIRIFLWFRSLNASLPNILFTSVELCLMTYAQLIKGVFRIVAL